MPAHYAQWYCGRNHAGMMCQPRSAMNILPIS